LTFSNGDKTVKGQWVGPGFDNIGVRGTLSHSSGKWYFEIIIEDISAFNWAIGVADGDHVYLDDNVAGNNDAHGVVIPAQAVDITGYYLYNNGSTVSLDTGDLTVDVGAVFGFAVNLDSRKLWISHNGTWFNAGTSDPAAGTGGCPMTGLSTAVFPYAVTRPGSVDDGAFVINTGGSAFTYGPPSGFSAWG
jgi:hypothetical protein